MANIEPLKVPETLDQTRERINRQFKELDTDIKTHKQSNQAHEADAIEYSGEVVGAVNAKQAIDNVQTQINTLVIDGDSSPAAAQAAIDADGHDYGNLKLRLDTEHTALSEQLADKANNWLSGSVINFMGDSITAIGDKPFPKIVGEILNCTTNNYGISGNMISGAGGMNERVLSMDKTASVNVVFGGTNDWNFNTPLGNIDDTVNTTIYGALNVMCLNLINTYPNAINVLITPLKRSKPSDVGFVDYSLTAVVKIISAVAKKYNFLVINLYDDAPNFNPNIEALRTMWAPDGLHPNSEYISKFLAETIAASLVSMQSSYVGGVESGKPAWISSLFTMDNYILEKDGNKVTTLNFNGQLNVSGPGNHIIGSVPFGYYPKIVAIISAVTYNPMSPITAWVGHNGDVVVSTDKAWTGTLYCNGSFRANTDQ